MKITLIIATLNRFDEVFSMLSSLRNAISLTENCDFEIIIIDQNKNKILDKLVESFSELDINHLKSIRTGLSFNRNTGLLYATGDIICFPDDDCLFYEDTFINVVNILSSPSVDFCIGRIYDRSRQKDIIKTWPKKELAINKLNSYFLNSSITLFLKKEWVAEFDENMGVGAAFGSCEDADYVYRLLKSGARGCYTPKVEMWHPEPDFNNISLDKVENYARGFGYFVSKEIDLVKVSLLFLLMGKKFIQMTLNIFNKKFQKKYFYRFFKGILSGLNRG